MASASALQAARASVLLLMIGLLSLGCRPDTEGETTPADAEAQAEESPSDRAAAEAAGAATCSPNTVVELIDGLALVDEESGCRIGLPAEVNEGTYTVRVSGAGLDDHASVEWRVDGERLFGDRGSVTLHEIGATLRGEVNAEDSTPPGTGRVVGSFDIAFDDAGP